jgi:hypothetical protein
VSWVRSSHRKPLQFGPLILAQNDRFQPCLAGVECQRKALPVVVIGPPLAEVIAIAAETADEEVAGGLCHHCAARKSINFNIGLRGAC